MKKVEQVKTEKGMSVDELVRAWGNIGAIAKNLSKATDIMEKMIKDKECTKFFGLAGAMVPIGMKQVIIDMVRDHWIDVLVTTGANLTHDLIEGLGYNHLQGDHKVDDAELHKKGLDRIYNVFMPNNVYEGLEEFCFKAFKEMNESVPGLSEGKGIGIREFLWELGKRCPEKNSILRACYEEKVPVYCPAIGDSGIGLMAWQYSQENKFPVLVFEDLKELMDLAFDSGKLAAVIIGGGVPKNHIVQTFQFCPNKASYAVQITMDRPEPGGSSGAELREAISWGKLSDTAEYKDVICDATIALPIISASLKTRLK